MVLDTGISTEMYLIYGHRTFFLFWGESAGTVGRLRCLGGRGSAGRGRREGGKVRCHSCSRSRIADGMGRVTLVSVAKHLVANYPYVVSPPPAAPPPMSVPENPPGGVPVGIPVILPDMDGIAEVTTAVEEDTAAVVVVVVVVVVVLVVVVVVEDVVDWEEVVLDLDKVALDLDEVLVVVVLVLAVVLAVDLPAFLVLLCLGLGPKECGPGPWPLGPP